MFGCLSNVRVLMCRQRLRVCSLRSKGVEQSMDPGTKGECLFIKGKETKDDRRMIDSVSAGLLSELHHPVQGMSSNK